MNDRDHAGESRRLRGMLPGWGSGRAFLLGRVEKQIAFELWPSLKMDTAYSRLRGCLNPDRPDKLTADEHLLIARLCDRYDFLFYCAQELHHSKPVAVAPEDERARLQREFVESTRALTKLAERIESIGGGNVSALQRNG